MKNEADDLIERLQEALGMEQAMAPMLQRLAQEEQLNVQVRDLVCIHLMETMRHLEMVKGCLEELGATPAPPPAAGGRRNPDPQDESLSSFCRDRRIRDLLTLQAAEQFEAGCYEALITKARSAGRLHVAAVCHNILEDEKRMIRWLDGHVSELVSNYGGAETAPAAEGDKPPFPAQMQDGAEGPAAGPAKSVSRANRRRTEASPAASARQGTRPAPHRQRAAKS